MLTGVPTANIIFAMIRRFIHKALVLLCVAVFAQSDSIAAKYAGEPFHVGVGGRALGMGGAYVAVVDDVTAGFWNPAGLSSLSFRQLAFMHSETFGALLNYDYVAFAAPLRSTKDSPVGAISLTRLGGGGIKLTDGDARVPQVPVIRKETGHADYQLLVSYSVRRTESLRIGASAKFVYRNLADNSAYGLGADIGAQYSLGNDVTLGMMVRDVTTTLLSYDNGTKESIFPTLIPGVSFSRVFGDVSLLVAGDAEVKFENYRETAQYWQGSISADTRLGVEFGFMNTAFGRIGSDIGHLALGGGIVVSSFRIDMAYLRNTDIDDSFRISLLYDLE